MLLLLKTAYSFLGVIVMALLGSGVGSCILHYTISEIYKIKSCIPLYMKYHIKREDWDQIGIYVKKYKLSIFYKCNWYKSYYAGR